MSRNPYGMSQSELCDHVEMYWSACKEIRELKTRIAELEQVSAAGVKDAERYQQLTAPGNHTVGIVAWHRHEDEEIVLTKSRADELIDAAMAKGVQS